MPSEVIEILVHHEFLNSSNPRPLARRLAQNQQINMLSYTRSPTRNRVDDGAYTASTPTKKVATQIARNSPSSMRSSNFESSPSYRLPPRTLSTGDESRTYRERDEVRDDTQARRTDWNREQNSRFQTRSPPFHPQVHHRASADTRAYQYHHHLGEGRWASHTPRTRTWSEYRPVVPHPHSDTEADPRYTLSYPVAHGQHHEGYVMQLHPRSTSFEQHRASQERSVLLHSQGTPPLHRYEDHPPPPRYRAHLERPNERFSAYSQALPQRRFESHSNRGDMQWHGQRVAIHSRAVHRNDSVSVTGTVSFESHQPVRRWSARAHSKTNCRPGLERNVIAAADTNLAQWTSSSREERRDANASEDDTKPSATIESLPSGQSDECSLSTFGLQELPPHVERARESAKRLSDSCFGYCPVISEDSTQSYEPAPSKRMKTAYDQRSDSATSSLELLCSATLDLGPLQENETGCSCPRSNCIKLYCDCFKAGRRCSSKCSCTNCKNTPAESGINGERTRAIKNILARNPRAFTGGKKEAVPRQPGDLVCNCVKSRCLKLYCDCFQKGKLCNDACLCVSCLNTEEESQVGGRRKTAIQQALEKRPDAFTKKPKEIGSGCACKNNR